MMRNLSPSNSSTYSGHSVSTISSANGQNRNRPQPSDYIKTHKNISFSFAENLYSFQLGNLGDSDSYLVGTVHLNYPRVCSVKSVYLHFKGTEKTCWYKSQARSKISYSGEHTLVDQSNKIWEAYEESEGIISLDIPFKIQLPINLQETITTEIGNAQYVLRVIVNTKGLLSTGTHIAKLHCPLRRTIILNQSLLSPYKICGESPSGIEYTFILPPNKYFNMGSYVSIPMMIRFLRSGIGIDRLEIGLKTLMDFSCSNQNEKTHIEQRISGLLIPNSELRYVQSNNPRYHLGEYVHTINIFVPRDLQPTYQGRLINITHQLCIKFCLFGFDKDFQVEEYIKIARIVENIEGPPLMHDSQISQIYNHNNKSISSLQIQHQQNVLLTSSIPHESFDQFRDYHRLVAPFDDRLDQSFDNNSSGSSSSSSSNNNNNNSTMQQSHLSYQSSQYSSSQHSLSHHTLNSYRSNNTLNSLNSQVSSNASSNYNNNNNKYRSLMHNKNPSNSEISSLHSLPTPLPVKEINTNYSSMITKSPYPTPLSPPPYRQPLIRQTSLNNNISAYNKYKKYTQ